MSHIGCSYLQEATTSEGLSNIIDRMAERITASGLTFSAIAFTGISGCLIGPTLALRLKKDMLIIRKPNISSHSSSVLEGFIHPNDYGVTEYIIVDDLVSCGSTVRRIVETVNKFTPSECKGVFIWSGYDCGPVVISDEVSVPVFVCPKVEKHVPATPPRALLAPPPPQPVYGHTADWQKDAWESLAADRVRDSLPMKAENIEWPNIYEDA